MQPADFLDVSGENVLFLSFLFRRVLRLHANDVKTTRKLDLGCSFLCFSQHVTKERILLWTENVSVADFMCNSATEELQTC